MREYFESRTLTGSISVTLEGRGVWTADKGSIAKRMVDVVKDFTQRGYRLTLRQLYYQLVAAEAIPNHDTVYKKISAILDDLRYSGKIDWNAIEDRGRVPKLPYFVNGVDDAIKDAIDTYRIDRQEGQPRHIELWTEKDAISNILYGVTQDYQVRLVINKGYTSSSAAYAAYARFAERIMKGQPVTVVYFGDHDPSGLDMIRDITDRLMTFLCRGSRLKDTESDFDKTLQTWWLDDNHHNLYTLNEMDYISNHHVKGCMKEDPDLDSTDAFEAGKIRWYLDEHNLFRVVPIGLTMQQIKQYNLPHNPAKITDPRAKDYILKHGQKSWEVDALRPDILASLVKVSLEALMDMKQFEKVMKKEKADIKKLQKFIKPSI